MSQAFNWDLTKNQQDQFIKLLTPELSSLRAKAGISQGDLSKLLGISRQTYSSLECGNREMSWSTYLSLILFYDYNNDTHQMIRNMGVFPDELLKIFNHGDTTDYPGSKSIAGVPDSITSQLDDTAFHVIRTTVMLEYARCTKLPGDALVKSFDGVTFSFTTKNEKAASALKAIKDSKKDRK